MSLSTGLSVAAVAISLLSAAFSYLQWREAHSQLLLSMRPSVDFTVSDDAADPPVGVSIENAGPGPATIKSIAYFVDKKPVGDVVKAMEFGHFKSPENIHTFQFEEGDTLAVGATEWLFKYGSTVKSKKSADDIYALGSFIDEHLAVEVEFCPVIPGNCSKRCSTVGWCK